MFDAYDPVTAITNLQVNNNMPVFFVQEGELKSTNPRPDY